jgi:hypothetical protein
MTTMDRILRAVTGAVDGVVAEGERHDGLFPSMLDRERGRLLDSGMPAPVRGQRNGDRAYRGSNLQHDHDLIAAMDMLAEAGVRGSHADAAGRYLRRFATHCAPASETGLFPWGEHAFWHLPEDRIGNSADYTPHQGLPGYGVPVHHQIARMPADQWRRIHEANPYAVARFAAGLDAHWEDDARMSFNRHAPIERHPRSYLKERYIRRTGRHPRFTRGGDFARATGLFVHDLVVAQELAPSEEQATMLRDFLNYWWDSRGVNGLCPKHGVFRTGEWNGWALNQTVGLAENLVAAETVARRYDAALAETLNERARTYYDALLAVRQPLLEQHGVLLLLLNWDNSAAKTTELWSGTRSIVATAKEARAYLPAAERWDDVRALDLARKAASYYVGRAIPTHVDVWARDMAAVIALLVDLHDLTGEPPWRDAAVPLASGALELFFDAPSGLPRGASSIHHYDAQLGTGALILALTRLALS